MDREITDRASKRMLQIMEFYHEQLFKEERMALIDINDVDPWRSASGVQITCDQTGGCSE